jgi:L-methionine (R)-S-oxide reductase
MWTPSSKYTNSEEYFSSLHRELLSLIEGEKNLIANLANISSWIYHTFPQLNWCGFYLWEDSSQELVLGPFQGRPACIRIRPGKGVCGTSYLQKISIRVDDVEQFPGHIACDQASQSELVIPLIHDNLVKAVLDLDSPLKARFSSDDENGLNKVMNDLAIRLYS